MEGCTWLRLFSVISAVLTFWLIFDMDEYLPWKVRFFRAMELSLIAHGGLWLATYDWKGWVRIAVAMIFLPALIGVTLVWWHVHLGAAVAVFGWLGWRFLQLIRGARHDSEPV